MELEEASQELRLAEQAIFRQCLEDREEKILGLEKRIEALEGLLNRFTNLQPAFPRPQLQPVPVRPAPRRWSVR